MFIIKNVMSQQKKKKKTRASTNTHTHINIEDNIPKTKVCYNKVQSI